MNIGFVSVWFERGAGYVTKMYMNLLNRGNNLFVYSRAGEIISPTEGWDQDYVHWGKALPFTRISWRDFRKWVITNKLDVVFFNEQRDFRVLYKCKLEFPNLKLGAYVDYYTADMVARFKYYDFLICNTLRHQSVFSWHPQSYYIPWGTDIDLYTPASDNEMLVGENVTFFHSAGMSNRKGTDTLIEVFFNTDLCKKSKLIIHSQVDSSVFTKRSVEEMRDHNIEFIQKTVGAPGLYCLGDVYVYPTTLDGLGLTMYEAMSSGIPVIAPDNAPMNEVVDDSVGSLIKVDSYKSREDGYYWPLCFVNKEDLYRKMSEYADDKEYTIRKKVAARNKAIKYFDLQLYADDVRSIFLDSKINLFSKEELINQYKIDSKRYSTLGRMNLEMVLPSSLVGVIEKLNYVLKEYRR